MPTKRLTEKQFDLLVSVNLQVAQISDALGSESSNSGLLYLTHETSLKAAAQQLMPANYRLVTLTASKLLSEYVAQGDERGETLKALLAMGTGKPTAALSGGEGFTPKASSRGGFYVLVFLRLAKVAGFNVLLAFSRAET